MKALTLSDIVGLETYEQVRPTYREALLAHKRERRLGVGDRISLAFEDRETLRYQVQEMTRIERIRDPARVQNEIDVYNQLMPGDGELSATLFIEIPELEQIRSELDRLLGIDEHVALVLGEGEDAEWIRARFDQGQMDEERISAVHYIRFALSGAQRDRFTRGGRARIAIDHPAYRVDAEISPVLRASLLRDLSGREPCLLDPSHIGPTNPAAPEVVYEDELVQVLRPAQPQALEHWWVEARDGGYTLTDAPSEVVAALAVRARQVASEAIERCGRPCRIAVEGGPGAQAPLRWHVVSVDD